MSLRDAILSKQATQATFEPRRRVLKATLVSVDGSVAAPARAGYVWCAETGGEGSVFQALNLATANVAGLAVLVAVNNQPPFREVTGIDTAIVELPDYAGQSFTTEHGSQHQWPDDSAGVDPVLVYQPALQLLKAEPAGGMVVSLARLVYHYEGKIKRFLGGTVDLSGLTPAAGMTASALVYLDAGTNTAAAVAGAAVYGGTPPDPDIPAGGIPSALTALAYGQTVITVVTDARGFLAPAPAGTLMLSHSV